MSFSTDTTCPKASVRSPGLTPPVLVRELNADDEEIVVDWSSGTAQSNVSDATSVFVDSVVETSRAELRARAQANELLGKFPFTVPQGFPPAEESVRMGVLEPRECKYKLVKSVTPALSTTITTGEKWPTDT